MSDRTSQPTSTYGLGRTYVDFSFQCNGASNPLSATVVGTTIGTTPGSQGVPPFIATLVHTATGKITVTLNDKFNKVVTVWADLDDTANDGAYATVGTVLNEGSGTAGISFIITTRAGATTTATDYSARIVRVQVCFRNTVSGQ